MYTFESSGKKNINFKKASYPSLDTFGLGYDYGSVMHYSPTSQSKNGRTTLRAKVHEFCCHTKIVHRALHKPHNPYIIAIHINVFSLCKYNQNGC